MPQTRWSRRQVLAVPLAAAAAATGRRPIRLGGPIFLKTEDPRDMAREHRRLGYSAAYTPKVSLNDRERIRAVREAFAAENVILAEVGAWVNMIDADPDKRSKNMQYVTDRMALADEVGALCCVDIGGSYNPTLWDGPDPANLTPRYFEAMVGNCRQVIDAVKPRRAKFTIEMMGWSLPDGPDAYLKLVKAVDRPAFGVHLDVCNIVNSPQRYYHNTELIHECFRKLGAWVTSCHAKDIGPRATHFTEVIPGRGGLDYKAYLTDLASLPQEAPLMLEHLRTAEEYDEGRQYIRKVAAECGVSFV